IGTFVSWGNHPETLSDVNNAISSDFVWALRDGMENGLTLADGTVVAAPAGGISLFMNGAVGGMMSPLHAHPTALDGSLPTDRTFAKAKAVGELVAKVALETLATAP